MDFLSAIMDFDALNQMDWTRIAMYSTYFFNYTVQYSMIRYDAVQYSTVQYSTVQYNTAQSITEQQYDFQLFSGLIVIS